MGGRGMGAAVRGGGCVSSSESRSAYRGGGRVAFKDGGQVHPRAGTQGLAKRGYKKGGITAQEDAGEPKHKKGVSLTADEDTKMNLGGRIKKAMGGSVIAPGAGAGTATGALQNQGAIIGAKKRRKLTKLGSLQAPSTPQASPQGAFPVVAAGKGVMPQ